MNHALLPSIQGASLPARYEAAKVALLECNRIDECKDWGDKMQALASYAKQADDKEMEKTALRIRSRAVRRCGELLKEIESATGAHRKSNGGDTLSRKQAAEDAGMSKRQKDDAIRVANVPEDSFEAQLESDNPPTITALAEQGTQTREPSEMEKKMRAGIPMYEQLGLTKKAFQAGMHGGGEIKRFARDINEYDPQDIVDGLREHDKAEIRRCIQEIDKYLDKIMAKL